MQKIPILSFTHNEFVEVLFSELKRGKEQLSSYYKQFIKNGFTDSSKPCFSNAQALYKEIEERVICLSLKERCLLEDEGTIKFLLTTHDGYDIESVVIPMKEGKSLCVSSQVGCKMGCTFCETGRMGLIRSLTAEEIVFQLFFAKHHLKEPIRNVVFMGMGEPFDNYDNVMKAFEIMTDQSGFAIGANRITISTSGRIDGIRKLTEDSLRRPNLAISVSAPIDTLRSKLVPWNRKENLSMLYSALKEYSEKTGKQILAAYVLLGGINDRIEDAKALAMYLRGLPVKINLIPYNPGSRDKYKISEPSDIKIFTDILRNDGYQVLRRNTKGSNVMAACGQLGNKSSFQLKTSVLQ